MTVTTKPLALFGSPIDEGSLTQIRAVLDQPQAVKGALMADHHKGYSMPIGGVVAFEDAISPNGVGYDIACGNMAVRTNLKIEDFFDDEAAIAHIQRTPAEHIAVVKPIMREIQKKISFGMGMKNNVQVDHPVLDLSQDVWLDIVNNFGADLHNKAVQQLGTVGGGNHYVDLLLDEFGYIWIADHFGSRGLGHTLASGFIVAYHGLKFTERVRETDDPVVFSTKSDIGQFYVEAMHLAGRYAYAGREYVIEQVLEILGAKTTFSVHNHHNFAWQENGLWVVRKGATPLTDDYAFIGGSMGDDSYIVRGVQLEEDGVFAMPDGEMYSDLYNRVVDLGNIGSAPHGAGRQMSRTQAAGKMRKVWACNTRDCGYTELAPPGVSAIPTCPECGNRKFRKIRMRDTSTAQIDWGAVRSSLTDRGIVVLGAGADEAPGAYKRLDEVLAHHPNIEIAHRLSPIGVVMAGPETHDPYKD